MTEVTIVIKTIDETTKKTKTINDKLKDLGKQLKVAAIAAVAFGFAVKKVFDLGRAGAVVTQTSESFELLNEKVGAAPGLLGRLEVAAGGTISTLKLASSVSTLLAGTQGELAKRLAEAEPKLLMIARAAAKLNPPLGSTQFLFESINTGIKRNSKLILDNLGIVFGAEASQKAFAESIGKTVKQLTDEEKTLATLEAAIRAGDTIIEQVGGNVDSGTDSFDRLNTAVANAADSFKEDVAPAIAAVADEITKTLTETDRYESALKALDAAVVSGEISIDGYREQLEELNDGQRKTADLADVLGPAFDDTGLAALEASKQYQGMSDAQIEAARVMRDVTFAAKDQRENLDALRASAVLAREQTSGLSKSSIDLSKSLGIVSRSIDSGLAQAGDKLRETLSELGPEIDDLGIRLSAVQSLTPMLTIEFVDMKKAAQAAGAEFEANGDITDEWAESNEDLAEAFRDARDALVGNQGATQSLASDLEELEEETRKATEATREAARALIFEQASAGLAGQELIDLAVAFGIYSETTAAGLKVTEQFRIELDQGTLSSATFALMNASLADSIARLESKNITITETIIRNVITRAAKGAAFDVVIQGGGEPVVEGTGLTAAQQEALRRSQLARAEAAKLGGFGAIGFARGGFTGSGSSSDIAGMVHKNEFVVPEGGALVSKGGGGPMFNIEMTVITNDPRVLFDAVESEAARRGVTIVSGGR